MKNKRELSIFLYAKINSDKIKPKDILSWIVEFEEYIEKQEEEKQ